MPARDHLRREEHKRSAPKSRPQLDGQGPLELAGQIGNSGMQQVAGSLALQRAPAAAGLLQRSTLARESEDEGPAAATPDAAVEAPAASPEGGVEKLDENVPETTEASGVENGSQDVSKGGGAAAADTGVSKQLEAPAGLVGPHGIETGKESEGTSAPAGDVSKVAGSDEKDYEAPEDEAA